MSQPLLSIGMIVKNEERCLEKCLKALEPLRQAISCELVIADTGSTDKTKEIATKYADILFDFVWVNDFSAARNAVMDKCTGKWYLTLDADEYLVPDISELVNFLSSKKSDTMKQATIVQRNHFDKNMEGTYSDFNAKRMCRMDTGVRYTSPIHEYFEQQITYDEIYILSNTIFNHDGYAHVSPEHKAKKEARNLELLEKKLETEPDNLKIILQCLESSANNTENRRYYTKYAINKLQNTTINDPNWSSCAANLAKQIALYLNFDCDPFQDEWFSWTFKTFPHSEHITIDTNYVYTKYLFKKERYIECIKTGKEYIKAFSKRDIKSNVASLEKITVSLLHGHEFHKNEILALIANAMLKETRESEALKLLTEINLYKQNNTVVNNWFSAITELKTNEKNCSKISTHISSILNTYSNEQSPAYDYLLTKISSFFSTDTEKNTYKLFSETKDAIGLSAKITDAKTKEEAEKLLKKIENWEEFMPSALKQAIVLQAELPEEFYLISSSHLAVLINDLVKVATEISDVISQKYCNDNFCNSFPRTSFIYNLLLAILTNTDKPLSRETKSILIDKFIFVANKFLSTCYNPELLKNEEFIVCIPTFHLFSWYLVKAESKKAENPLEYIKTLRVLLKKTPQAKEIVEFLIEEYKKEEEQRKQEQIKNAAPELIQMATQLKTMLAALPKNSPELLAIKQSPLYQQVAFLIEE